MTIRRKHLLGPVALLALLGAPLRAQSSSFGATVSDSIRSVAEATQRRSGEAVWMPMVRLRALDDGRYKGTSLATIFPQFRMAAEGTFGNQAEALRLEDHSGLVRQQSGTYVIPPGTRASDAVTVIGHAADSARVIMVNERHHVPASRMLSVELLPVLFARGYRYLAIEAVASTDSSLQRRGYPLERISGRDGVSGSYTDEPVFGELIREAIRLGYRVVPYEIEPAQDDTTHGPGADVRRDSVQAVNLVDRTLRTDPQAKIFVHAGYGHIDKSNDPRRKTMAVYFRQLTGIDPFTVDQTALAEHSEPRFESPAYRAAVDAGMVRDRPMVLFDSTGVSIRPTNYPADLQVLTPRTTIESHGRPSYMSKLPDRKVFDLALTECRARVCVVEARLATEPDSAVAMDRVETVNDDSARLFVSTKKPSRITIRDEQTRKLLRSINVPADRRP